MVMVWPGLAEAVGTITLLPTVATIPPDAGPIKRVDSKGALGRTECGPAQLGVLL